jgi:hypothetical protein
MAEQSFLYIVGLMIFDIRTWDGIMPALHEAGYKTIVPYLRGFGPITFLNAQTIRSGKLPFNLIVVQVNQIDTFFSYHIKAETINKLFWE